MSIGIPWGLAQRRAVAVNHLVELMGRLSEVYGVAPVEFTHSSSRADPMITQMQELERLDDWLTALMPLLVPEDEPGVSLDDLTVPQLRDYAFRHRINISTATGRAEIVALITSATTPEVLNTTPDVTGDVAASEPPTTDPSDQAPAVG